MSMSLIPYAVVTGRSRPRVIAIAVAALALVAGLLGTTALTASAASTLLSQGQPTTASSVENATFPASNATDGNTATRWSSAFSDPQWLQVDLGGTASVTQVVLQWEAAYGKAFQIQTSPDAVTWTPIFSTTTGTGGTQTLNVTGTGRYVRMLGTARGTAYGYSLFEFQVFGTLSGGGGCGTANAALNHPATASSIEGAGTPASAAFDGNTGTRWSSAFSDPQWLQVDLGSSQNICKVTLNWEAAYGKAFQIQTSPDAVTWTPIFSTTTGTGGIQNLTVSGTGRYVRMYGTVRGTVYGYSLWEMSVFTTATTGNIVTVTTPATQTSTVGTAVSKQITATDSSSGQTLTFTATGLPAGLSISSSGLITGTPTTAATSTTVVTATDGTGASGSASFSWVVTNPGGNIVTVTNPGTQNSVVGTAVSTQITATDSASGQTLTFTATGLPAGLSISSSGLITGTPTTAATSTTTVTATDTTGAHGATTFTWVVSTPGACPAQSNTPNFGPNVHIFDPSMSSATIQATLDSVFNAQKLNQFGTRRDALLFKPGTYANTANMGYYTSIAGLGQNPDDVLINGDVTVDAFDGTGNATQNFWRSAENLAITPSSGNDRWAVAQAGPFRRIDVHGGLQLYPASFGFASRGYIADTKASGQVATASQQQWYSRDSNFGSWNGSVWNMVFSGVTGAPAQSFPTPPITTMCSCRRCGPTRPARAGPTARPRAPRCR